MQKLDAQGRPVMGKDGKPVTEVQEIQVPAFKIVSVFDVSQTEGEPLPSIGVEELTGSVERYGEFFKALEQTSPVPIGFEDIPGGSHGYYHLTEKRIAIQEGMSELQTLKTAIHEIAHSKLHAIDPEAPAIEQADRPDSRTREVQAESVAYAVCQHYGLDTSDYSFGYVAGWSSGKDLKELKASLETIRTTAHELITTIDGHLERGRGQYLDGLFAFLYIAVKIVPPLIVARHKLSALHGDQEGVVEAVTVELGHSGEIGFVAFTLEKLLCAGFQPVGDLFHALGAVLAVKENGGDRLRGLCRRCRLRLHLAFLPQNFRRGIGHHPVFLRHRLALMDALPFVAAFYQIAIIGKNTMLCVGNMQAKTGQENPSFPFLRHIHHAGTV